MMSDRKLGGILCEARWQGDAPGWIVAGIGLNVANPIPGPVRDTAIALAERMPGVTADALLPALLDRLRRPLRSDDRLQPDEAARLRARDWLLGRTLAAPVAGGAEGVAPDGALLVRIGGALTPVRGGPVELAAVASPR
jgi:biotin-(acetyl-CoA carboxylase) ligase